MTDLDDALLDEYAAAETTESDENPDGWRIENDDQATWALRKLAAARAEIERIEALAAAEIDRVQQWKLDTASPRYSEAVRFESYLIDYRRRLEAENPKLPKTYTLPTGAILRRQAPLQRNVVDEDAAKAWLVAHDREALKTSVLVSRFTPANGYVLDENTGRIVDADGEVVPGVQVTRPDDMYGVKT